MSPIERVEIMLEAIKSVKDRANRESLEGDPIQFKIAMEDLLVLECSLVYESQQLVDFIRKTA